MLPSAQSIQITASDISVATSEPTIKDVTLGEALGMARPTNIRSKIEENLAELEGFGVLHRFRAKSSDPLGRGRPSTEYHLTEPQALLVCMFARTERAAEIRRQLIDAFMAWRRGETRPAPQPQSPVSAIDRMVYDVIQKAGEKGISGHTLWQATRRLSPRDRRAAVESLCNRGLIRFDVVPKHRPRRGWTNFVRIYYPTSLPYAPDEPIRQAYELESDIAEGLEAARHAVRLLERAEIRADQMTRRRIHA